MNIPLLPPGNHYFPDPRHAIRHHDGLVALSSDLTVLRLLAAYRQGIFPWFTDNGLFYWFATAPRMVLHPDGLHIGRSLQKTLRHKPYLVTANRAFENVIAGCARSPRPGQEGTWIAPEFQHAYTELHRSGHAHSFECWYPDGNGKAVLAGGFYGVQIGRMFYGESMFAAQTDAAKIAFACAVPHLAHCGIEWIDCQQETPHLARFGARPIPFDDFRRLLDDYCPQGLLHPIRTAVLVSNHMPDGLHGG